VGKKYQNGGKSIKSKSKVMKERVDILRTTRESTFTSCVLRQQEEIRIVIVKILYIFVK
jgi:hypothetical protein